jgi:hypothetical protein
MTINRQQSDVVAEYFEDMIEMVDKTFKDTFWEWMKSEGIADKPSVAEEKLMTFIDKITKEGIETDDDRVNYIIEKFIELSQAIFEERRK